ncbi:MAG: ABC transporter substrate-binding protein [Promethearchaeota archaeon]|jgi:ABC-type transport system substrate-binding protein
MRKFSNTLIYIIFLSSLVLPFFPVKAQVAAQIPVLKIGVQGGAVGSWDGIIATSGFHNSFGVNALEGFVQMHPDWSGDPDDLLPVLATSWEIFDWPEQMNNHPDGAFINRGGIMAIELTLRTGVTFHDGSAWNATVAKWNIDRNMVMTGNITGSITAYDIGVTKARTSYWCNAEDWVDYETEAWNVSQYLGKPGEYEGFGNSTDEDMIGRYCRIKNVTILEDLPSGGKIRINYNDWGGAGSQLLYGLDFLMISMDAYKDYFDLPIYGLGDQAGFPQPVISGDPDDYPSTGFPGHMIGTGPYVFIGQDLLIFQGGTMKRNANWWNTTAAQAEGWHKIPELGIRYFLADDLTGRTIGMVTGTIDLAFDALWGGSLSYQEMINAPNVYYMNLGYEATRTFITLNCINETYWKTWADLGPGNYPPEIQARANSDYHDMDSDGTIHVDGIDRALRKALSYVFDYDKFINTSLQGRGVRAGGFLGVENEYYNSSIPIAYRNLTIARQTLIDDLKWGPIVANRSLDINNATDDWIWVANNDPIFEFKLLWEDATIPQADLFLTNMKDIGIKLATGDGKRDSLLKLHPNLYNVLIMRYDEIPIFTYHGVPTNWPDANIGNVPVIEYYYKSPGLPYKNGSGLAWPGINYLGGQFFNIGFNYNATVDDWIKKLWFSDRPTSQAIMNNLTIHSQTFQFPEIYISHNSYGIALHTDWEYSDVRGGILAFVKHLPTSGGGGVQIPGFQTASVLAFIIVTITGIGYSLNRKRKRA